MIGFPNGINASNVCPLPNLFFNQKFSQHETLDINQQRIIRLYTRRENGHGSIERLHDGSVKSKKSNILSSILEFKKISSSCDFHILSKIFEHLTNKCFPHDPNTISTRSKIKSILCFLDERNRNLMQLAAYKSICIEFHKTLLDYLEKYLSLSEISQIIKNVDNLGLNYLLIAAKYNSKEIVELSYQTINKFLTYNEKIELLKIRLNNQDLLTCANENKSHPDVYDFLKNILHSVEERIKFEDDKNLEDDSSMFIINFNNSRLSSNIKNQYELIEAVKENDFDRILYLLRIVDDTDKKDKYQMSAVDYAWRNYIDCLENNRSVEVCNKILLQLLNNNSKFPAWLLGFDCKKTSREVRKFLNMCKELHKNLEIGRNELVLQKIKNYPHLRYFYNQGNESLLLLALKNHNYDFLDKVNGQISIHKNEGLIEVYYAYFMNIDDESSSNERNLPPFHLLMLIAKSRIVNTKDSHKYWNLISNAYKSLNEIKCCSKILQIAALSKDLKMFFDFSNNNNENINTKGITYDSGSIYIGAKDLGDVRDRNTVLGVIIHELCHLALLITYMNNFNPYPIGESKEKENFQEIFKNIRENIVESENEKIIQNVFHYEDITQHSEFIVRLLQIIVHYRENYAKLNQLQQIYCLLFDYFQTVVEPELDKVLPLLKKFYDERCYLVYEELTEPMKAKLLYSKIIFQGHEMTFLDLIGNNYDTMNSISSNDIRKVIQKDEQLVIGIDLKSETKSLNLSLVNLETGVNDTESLINIQHSTFIFRVLITNNLKESELINIAEVLKEANKSYWVSFTKLKDVCTDFKRIMLKTKNVIEKLQNIFKIKSETEIELFAHFYRNRKVILMFDGFDEIHAEFGKDFIDLMKEIENESKSQIWISTKSQFIDILKQNLKLNSYKIEFVNDDSNHSIFSFSFYKNKFINLFKNST